MKVFLTVAAFLALSANTMFADALFTDGTWEEFLFGSTGSFATGCGGSCALTTDPVADASLNAPWTFNGPAILQVLDLFVAGDQFAVFDNSVLLSNTSVPTNTGVSGCSNDIGCALADTADYSYLDIALGGGSHSITIQVIQNASGDTGGAAVLSATATPEPGTLALLAGGLGTPRFQALAQSLVSSISLRAAGGYNSCLYANQAYRNPHRGRRRPRS